MKKIVMALVLVFICQLSNAQFKPGWYIIEPGTEYSVLEPSASEVMSVMKNENNEKLLDSRQFNMVVDHIELMAGEPILITDNIDDTYITTDPANRLILVKGKVSHVIQKEFSTIGLVKQPIQLLSGKTVRAGMFVWIIEKDPVKNTYIIQYTNNSTMTVEAEKIEIYKSKYSDYIHTVEYKKSM
jgi:hypothetical protein